MRADSACWTHGCRHTHAVWVPAALRLSWSRPHLASRMSARCRRLCSCIDSGQHKSLRSHTATSTLCAEGVQASACEGNSCRGRSSPASRCGLIRNPGCCRACVLSWHTHLECYTLIRSIQLYNCTRYFPRMSLHWRMGLRSTTRRLQGWWEGRHEGSVSSAFAVDPLHPPPWPHQS
jgi:hypothetical protein